MDILCNRLVVGLFTSIIVGAFVIHIIVDVCLWGYLKRMKIVEKPEGLFSGVLGICERLLYMAALFAGEGTWIAVWLTLKVAVKWHIWQEKGGRHAYNVFLIGNSLSIIFGILGVWIIKGIFPSLR